LYETTGVQLGEQKYRRTRGHDNEKNKYLILVIRCMTPQIGLQFWGRRDINNMLFGDGIAFPKVLSIENWC
jgi:hypothetical protein